MADEKFQGEEPIDFQRQFLFKKIDELIESIGPGYGEALMEELISRMERTVALFHEEVAELIESLKQQREKREAQLKEILEHGEVLEKDVEASLEMTSAEVEMSEYERKLEERTRKEESRKVEEKIEKKEKPKKRGFFHRKK